MTEIPLETVPGFYSAQITAYSSNVQIIILDAIHEIKAIAIIGDSVHWPMGAQYFGRVAQDKLEAELIKLYGPQIPLR